MADPQLRTHEEEISDVRRRISDEERTEARLRSDADQVLAQVQEDVEKRGADRFSPENIAKVDEAYKEPDSKRDQINGLRSHLANLLERAGRSGETNPMGPGVERRARRGDPIARAFLESDAYKRAVEIARSDGRIEQGPVSALDRDALVDMFRTGGQPRMRATFDESQGGAMIPVDQQVFPPVALPQRPVRLSQLVNSGTTDSDVVKWAQQTLRTEAAAETPFGTPAPEAAYTYAPVQSNVQRIPVFVPATRDQLADQGQTETLIEGQLRFDVLHRVESQILVGGGNAANQLPGVLGASGINIVTVRDGAHTTEYDLDAVHRAITAIRLSLFDEPTSVGLHPTNYEKLVLQKDSQGRYVYQPTGTEGPVSIWGLMPIISAVFTVGTAFVADWQRAYTLWLREALTVTASDGYMDFFTRGMVAIMATVRAAGGLQQPRAITQLNGLPTS